MMIFSLDSASRDDGMVTFSNDEQSAFINMTFEQWVTLESPYEIEL